METSNLKIGILRNEDENSSKKWQIACENLHLDYRVIDLTSADWQDEVVKGGFNFCLLKPPGMLEHFKLLYDERIYIISKILKIQVYPSYEEVIIYENKKLLSYYLEAKKIPHPATKVFYSRTEAVTYINTATFPIVAKTSIGASGSGVQIIRNIKQAEKYINKAFSRKGIKRRFGPNRVTGKPTKWFKKAVSEPGYLFKKLKEYLLIFKHSERDLVLFQEYIPHSFEWRVVRIGESYFAHKKIKSGEKASGSKGIDYVTPPRSLLDFCREICKGNNFHFMAIDLFEDGKGRYLVNELQTIFGHVQDCILKVNDIPGRYLFYNNQWIFEPGDFNTNESYDLRLKTALELYARSQ